jgi:hypothetical protein
MPGALEILNNGVAMSDPTPSFEERKVATGASN